MHGSLPFAFPQPLSSEIAHTNVSDSESDSNGTECDHISNGLYEVLSAESQSYVVQGRDKKGVATSLQLSREEPCRGDFTSARACGPSDKVQPVVTSGPPDAHSDEEFSDIVPPFAAHSDPFQFTVRLPRSVEAPWCTPVSGDNATNKSPPWNEIRSNARTTAPSTEYIYSRTRCDLSPKKPVGVEEQARGTEPQHPSVSQKPLEVPCA